MALQVSYGAAINFNNFVGTTTSLSGFTITTEESTNDLVYSFTSTGNLDGGTADDTFSFDIVDSAFNAGGVVDNNTEENGTAALHFGFNEEPSTNPFLNVGSGFTIQVTNIVYARGEVGVAETFTFDGFTAIGSFVRQGGANVSLNGGTEFLIDAANDIDLTSFGTTDTLAITQDGNDNIRFRNLDFGFTLEDSLDVVPEPSSMALLALGALGFMRRRR